MNNFLDQFDDQPKGQPASNFLDSFDDDQAPQEEVGLGTELANTFGRGAANLVGGVGTAVGLATGNMDNAVSQYGDRMESFYDKKSPALVAGEKQRQTRMDSADGELGKAGAWLAETFTDPRLVANMFVEQIPGFAIPGGAGAATARVGKLAADKLAQRGAKKSAELIGKYSGTAAAVGVGGAMQSMDVAGGAYDDLIKIPDKEWSKSEEYQSMVQDGIPAEIAKDQIARKLALQAGTASFAVSLASQFLPGGKTFEKVVGRGDRTGVSDSALNRFATGFLGEGLQEGFEEGGGQLVSNIAVGQVDSNRGLMEGTGVATVAGAAMGGPVGGAFNVLAGPDATPTPVTDDEVAAEEKRQAAEIAANERMAMSMEADEIAQESANAVEAQGGDALDQLDASVSTYNQVESAQKSIKLEDDGIAALLAEQGSVPASELVDASPLSAPDAGPEAGRGPSVQSIPGSPMQEAVTDARAIGDENSAIRLENANRLVREADELARSGDTERARKLSNMAATIRQSVISGTQEQPAAAVERSPEDQTRLANADRIDAMAAQAEERGSVESAQRLRNQSADIRQSIQGLPVAEVTQETTQEFQEAERVVGTEARAPVEPTLIDQPPARPALPQDNVIYGAEPQEETQRRADASNRRETKQAANKVALEGIIEPGQAPRNAAPMRPFESEVPEDVSPAIATSDPTLDEDVTDDDYSNPIRNVFTVGDKSSRGTLDVIADLEDDAPRVAAERGLEMDVVSMSPSQYIQQAADERARAEKTTSEYEIKKRREAGEEKIASIAADMEAGVQFAAPSLDYSEGGFSQDGLHRAMAAERLGLRTMPVSVVREAANMEVREAGQGFSEARRKKALADAFRMLEAKTITEQVTDDEGAVYEVDRSAATEVRQINKRLSVLDSLLACQLS